MAAREAYKSFESIQPFIHRQTQILKVIGTYCCSVLEKYNIRVHPPQGAFYLFLDFSLLQDSLKKKGIHTSTELCRMLLNDTGVVLLPSVAFGFDADFLGARLAYVDFDEPATNETFTLKDHCPRIIKGIEALCQWISDI
jgi:aspartate aminotransferase